MDKKCKFPLLKHFSELKIDRQKQSEILQTQKPHFLKKGETKNEMIL